MLINYPYGQMGQGALDMAGANKQVTDLQGQFQDAMNNLFAAWSSPEGSAQFQEVQKIWVQANEEINLVLGRRADALDEAQIGMRRADQRAADAAQRC
jgi:uncharacterized protein YukE